MKKYLVDNFWSLAVIAFTIGLVAIKWNLLPASVPTHFDIDGRPDQYSPKGPGLFWLIGVAVAYLGLMPVLLKISPRGYRLEDCGEDVGRLNLAVVTLMCGIELAVIFAADQTGRFPIYWSMGLTFGIFMVLLGNHLGRIGRNFVMGIRVPWALADERNWKLTHRFAGRLYVGVGCVTLLWVCLGLPPWGTIALFLLPALLPVIYSWNVARLEEARTGKEPPRK